MRKCRNVHVNQHDLLMLRASLRCENGRGQTLAQGPLKLPKVNNISGIKYEVRLNFMNPKLGDYTFRGRFDLVNINICPRFDPRFTVRFH